LSVKRSRKSDRRNDRRYTIIIHYKQRFIKESSKELEEYEKRNLGEYDFD